MRRTLLMSAVLVLPLPSAATLVSQPRPALCARAELVVVGEVTGAETRWSEGALGELETRWDIAALRTVRGQVPAEGLVLRTPGGARDGVRLTVSTAPTLAQDHLYLLLLRADGDAYAAVGDAQGVIPLRRGAQGEGEPLDAALATLEPCRVD